MALLHTPCDDAHPSGPRWVVSRSQEGRALGLIREFADRAAASLFWAVTS